MPDIFISYSRKNKEFVQRVYGALAEQKRDIWVDWEDIPLSADWWQEICTGIESSNSIVVVMTPDSMSSPICAMEIDHALKHGKRLIPLVREPADEKTSFAAMTARELDDNAKKALGDRQILDLAKQNWNALARHNWLFFRDEAEFDTTFGQLVSAIDTDLDHVKQHTRLLMRAREWENKGKDSSYLLSGTDIADAEKWIAQNVAKQPNPLPLHGEYIRASRIAATRRQRMLLIGVSVAFVISLALTALSFVLFRQSEASRELADINAANAISAQETSDANSELAFFMAGTAVSAQSTAVRRAEESGSVAMAQNAQNIAPFNPFLAYALAIDAASIENPPPVAEQVLGNVADINAIRRLPGPQSYVTSLIFTPDSENAFSATSEGQIFKWNVETAEIIDTFSGGYNNLTVFSPDTRYAALQTDDYGLAIVDLATHEILYTIREHNSLIASAAFSGNGRYLISGSSSEYDEGEAPYNVVVWDMETREVVQRMDDLPYAVNLVNLNYDGSLALVALYEEEADAVHLWDIETGEILRTLHNYDVTGITFNPSSSQIWIDTAELGISVLGVEEDTEYSSPDWHIGSNFAFTPSGSYVALGDELTRNIQIWDGETLIDLYSYRGHDIPVTAIAISPDERFLLSGDENGAIILWDFEAFHNLNYFKPYLTPNVDAQIAMDGETLAWVEGNGYVTYSNGNTANSYGIFDGLTTIAISPNGQSIVFGTSDGMLWNADLFQDDGFESVEFNSLTSAITAVVFSTDNLTVFTGAEDGSLVSWDYATGDEITRIVEAGSAITALARNPQGATLVSGSIDGNATIYDIASGEIVHTLAGHNTPISTIAYSFDGRYILTGDNRGTVTLWDAATGTLLHTLIGQELLAATSAAFSPDGTMMAAGFDNGALMVWEVATGNRLRTYLAHTSTITSIRFTDNNVGVTSISTDGTSANHIIETVPHMIDWLYQNRDVPVLTCAQRLQYNAAITCDENGVFPTATPFPMLTPTPAP